MPSTENNDEDGGQRGLCPLCGTAMVARSRSALARVKGLLLAYAMAFLALVLLPRLDTGTGSALALLAGWGIYMMRASRRQWCPGCWFVREP